MSLDNHLSRRTVTGTFRRDGPPHCLYPVLLRMGFTYAPAVTSKAVVSYTALPPLPELYPGGIFLLHYPWSRLHRTLSGILPCEARTFLTCCLSAIAAAIICATQSFLVCIFFYHTEYINTELGFFAKSYKTAAVLRAVFVL